MKLVPNLKKTDVLSATDFDFEFIADFVFLEIVKNTVDLKADSQEGVVDLKF